jgi:hypothetical protein
MEHGERVFTALHASVVEDIADKVDAGVPQQRERRRLGEEFNINNTDVADDVGRIIQNCQR